MTRKEATSNRWRRRIAYYQRNTVFLSRPAKDLASIGESGFLGGPYWRIYLPGTLGLITIDFTTGEITE